MTEDAHIGPHQVAAAGPAEKLGKLYRWGCVLLVVATIAIGFGCIFEPWLDNEPTPVLALVALVLYPLVWLLLLPFRVVGIAVGGVLELVRAIIFLPARVLRAI